MNDNKITLEIFLFYCFFFFRTLQHGAIVIYSMSPSYDTDHSRISVLASIHFGSDRFHHCVMGRVEQLVT